MKLIEEMRSFAAAGVLVSPEDVYAVVTAWADSLGNSGALVPVPVGEPCERRRCVLDTFEHDGCIYFDAGDGYCPKRISDGAPIAVSWNAIVRPVRLVPIEQWDAEG